MITLKELHERDKRPPSVTVSMLCYNHSKYIDKAIQGVLMQKTNFPVSIVIHDDASPDGSAEIIKRYAAENPNIIPILQPKNLFQQRKSSLPFLLPHYTGKYIAYCECDDFWLDEHKLQIQVDYLEANPDCMAVYSNTLPVNKYSEYDESVRVKFYAKTGEGDYPSSKIYGCRHQLATCVIRNFWQFMTPEDVEFWMHLRGAGDQRILAFALHTGRVHYFAQEFAAYRQVTDEGDSFSARMRRMPPYDKLKGKTVYIHDLYKMIEHFFGKKYYRKYLALLLYEAEARIKFRRSVLKDTDLEYLYKEIPWYSYLILPFYTVYRIILKTLNIL